MTVGEEDGIRGEVMVSQEFQEVLDTLVRGHAGVHHRAGLLVIGPEYYAIGTQGVKSKYAGLKHRQFVIIANLLTFCQLCRIKDPHGCISE
jgi:hypothetical protein